MKCSKCPAEIDSLAMNMCPDCHAKEVAKVHARDTPDIPELTGLPKYCPPAHLCNRPNSDGQRVIRKSTTMS